MRKILLELIMMLFAILNVEIVGHKETSVNQTETTTIGIVQESEAETSQKESETTCTESVTETETYKQEEEITTENVTVKNIEPTTKEVETEILTTQIQVETTTQQQTKAEICDYVYKDGNGNSITYHTLEEAKANIPVVTNVVSINYYYDMENQLLELINQYRVSNGLCQLVINKSYEYCAYYRATESAENNWNVTANDNGAKRHIRPNFNRASSIMGDNGITFTNYSEDYARFFQDPQSVLTGWQNSPTHNSILLTSWATGCGIGIAKDSCGYYYWIFIVVK